VSAQSTTAADNHTDVLISRRVSVLTDSPVEFGVIPKSHWFQPDWIDEQKASKARERMVAANVKYGDSVSYVLAVIWLILLF